MRFTHTNITDICYNKDMKTSQISNRKRADLDFGAPEDLNVKSREQLEDLLRESIVDTREGYTINQVKTSLAHSRERATA